MQSCKFSSLDGRWVRWYPTIPLGWSQDSVWATHRCPSRHRVENVDYGEVVSHPGSKKQNWSLYTCVKDVQITRIVNNMVNRYNISINYKQKSYKMTLRSERRLQSSSDGNLSVGVASIVTIRGEVGLVFIFWLLLVLLIWLQNLNQSKVTIKTSLSRLMVAMQQVGENMRWGLFNKDG
jgi:hypothetical protein